MDARETILDNIRNAASRNTAPPDTQKSTGSTGDGHAAAARADWESDLIARFKMRAEALASTVIGPIAHAQVTSQIAGYLKEHQLPSQAVCWSEISRLDWSAVGITVEARAARGSDLVGITESFCAIADTGTLMLLSGRETPATVSLLPETHIAVVPVARMVARMEDAWALVRSEHGSLPRAVNFVSGPSRTADIEQTVTLGAHGPYRVLIVFVDNG